jgi:hypothetical protein
MEFEETRRLGALGYDEKSETWFLQSKESQRLVLTRQSLAHLVQLYNSVHKGKRLALVDHAELRKLEETGRRQAEALRDLRLLLERREGSRVIRWARCRVESACQRLVAAERQVTRRLSRTC